MTSSILIPVVIVKSKKGFNALSPKIYGCIATDNSIEKVLNRFKGAITLHLKHDKRALEKISKARHRIYFNKQLKEYGTKAFYTFVVIKLKT